MDLLPAYYSTGQGLWRVRCPLICLNVVEWHYADRVLRQFGLRQFIPRAPENSIYLHGSTGRSYRGWEAQYRYHIALWGTRDTLVVTGDDTHEHAECDLDYMSWYRSVTRRQILNPRLAQETTGEFEGTHGTTTYLAENLARVYHILEEAYKSVNVRSSEYFHINEAMLICNTTLTNVGQSHLLDHRPIDPVPQSTLPRTRGRGSRRTDTSSIPVYTEYIPSTSQPRDIPSTSQPRDIPSSSRTPQGDVETNYMDYDSSQFCTPHHLIHTQTFPSPLPSIGQVPSNYQVFPSPLHAQHVEAPSTYIREPRRGPPREARDRGRPCGTHDRVHR